eukprot:PhF_6_TR7962/c1_g1_i5/m.12069
MVSQCPYHPAVFCGLIAVLKVHCKNNTRKAKTMKNHLKTAHDFLQPLQSSFSLASRDECFQNQLVCRNPGSLQQQSCPDPPVEDGSSMNSGGCIFINRNGTNPIVKHEYPSSSDVLSVELTDVKVARCYTALGRAPLFISMHHHRRRSQP